MPGTCREVPGTAWHVPGTECGRRRGRGSRQGASGFQWRTSGEQSVPGRRRVPSGQPRVARPPPADFPVPPTFRWTPAEPALPSESEGGSLKRERETLTCQENVERQAGCCRLASLHGFPVSAWDLVWSSVSRISWLVLALNRSSARSAVPRSRPALVSWSRPPRPKDPFAGTVGRPAQARSRPSPRWRLPSRCHAPPTRRAPPPPAETAPGPCDDHGKGQNDRDGPASTGPSRFLRHAAESLRPRRALL